MFGIVLITKKNNDKTVKLTPIKYFDKKGLRIYFKQVNLYVLIVSGLDIYLITFCLLGPIFLFLTIHRFSHKTLPTRTIQRLNEYKNCC